MKLHLSIEVCSVQPGRVKRQIFIYTAATGVRSCLQAESQLSVLSRRAWHCSSKAMLDLALEPCRGQHGGVQPEELPFASTSHLLSAQQFYLEP